MKLGSTRWAPSKLSVTARRFTRTGLERPRPDGRGGGGKTNRVLTRRLTPRLVAPRIQCVNGAYLRMKNLHSGVSRMPGPALSSFKFLVCLRECNLRQHHIEQCLRSGKEDDYSVKNVFVLHCELYAIVSSGGV